MTYKVIILSCFILNFVLIQKKKFYFLRKTNLELLLKSLGLNE